MAEGHTHLAAVHNQDSAVAPQSLLVAAVGDHSHKVVAHVPLVGDHSHNDLHVAAGTHTLGVADAQHPSHNLSTW